MRLGDDPSRRAALVLLLVALQVGMLFEYGTYDDRRPTAEDFAADYESHVGRTVALDGTLVSTDPPVVAVDGTGERFELTLRGFDRSVEEGTVVDIYGTLAANHTVEVQRSVVYPGLNRQYMYGISFLALVFVVALGLRDWRFDTDSLVFRQRRDD